MKKLIEISDDLRKELNVMAAKADVSLTRYIVLVLEGHVKQQKPK